MRRTTAVWIFAGLAALASGGCSRTAPSPTNAESGGALMAKGRVRVGDRAPDFSLPSQTGQAVGLKEFEGRKAVVLYFYPKDETAVCTKEACAFRDSFEAFKEAGAVVLGVSSDSVESHREFAAHHNLPFTLLSDEGGRLRARYGVPATLGLLPGRVTYLIDKHGIVRCVFSSQFRAHKHVTQALKVLKEIESAK